MEGGNELECVRGGLPFPVYLDLDFYAFVNVLSAALVAHTELQNIAVSEFEGTRL